MRGALAGLLTAALLVADPGADDGTPDAVAVVAVTGPDAETVVAWVGDCRAYAFDGQALRQYTTDHTVGQQLRQSGGIPLEVAESHDHWLRVSLSRATPATAYEVVLPAGELVLLTSDGVHDQVAHAVLEALVRDHHADPQALADALVAAAEADEGGTRDDATAVILAAR
ncbi:hypothetical protein Acor_80550 [Acrocarpospora corrugata]|uniref:PPM-type phosphatase domain-containing protein n=1 Tax=Acrocarpospora corrugata TaxID=35763 RepID=A0A5M3WB01_9ACTN|nr:SpoIIE family protein phosphatase [Acrocarpospora corrugata]GES05986.1 hypothetical protein Acor_80550 [Acrocarpospora corrugata]